jgi:hypothetical protein
MSQAHSFAAAAVAAHLFSWIASVTGAIISIDLCQIPSTKLFPATLSAEELEGVRTAADFMGRWLRDNVDTLPDVLGASDILPALRAYYEEYRTALCPPIIEAIEELSQLAEAA